MRHIKTYDELNEANEKPKDWEFHIERPEEKKKEKEWLDTLSLWFDPQEDREEEIEEIEKLVEEGQEGQSPTETEKPENGTGI